MALLLRLGCSLLALSTCLLPRVRADCGRDCAACAYRLGPRAGIHPLVSGSGAGGAARPLQSRGDPSGWPAPRPALTLGRRKRRRGRRNEIIKINSGRNGRGRLEDLFLKEGGRSGTWGVGERAKQGLGDTATNPARPEETPPARTSRPLPVSERRLSQRGQCSRQPQKEPGKKPHGNGRGEVNPTGEGSSAGKGDSLPGVFSPGRVGGSRAGQFRMSRPPAAGSTAG